MAARTRDEDTLFLTETKDACSDAHHRCWCIQARNKRDLGHRNPGQTFHLSPKRLPSLQSHPKTKWMHGRFNMGS